MMCFGEMSNCAESSPRVGIERVSIGESPLLHRRQESELRFEKAATAKKLASWFLFRVSPKTSEYLLALEP
jgi:hypothetical protein